MQILKVIWDFFQGQILAMKWLNSVIGSGLSALGLDLNNRWVGSIQFFLYDVIKITILLCFLIFLISYIQSYFPPERSKRILGRFHESCYRWRSYTRSENLIKNIKTIVANGFYIAYNMSTCRLNVSNLKPSEQKS